MARDRRLVLGELVEGGLAAVDSADTQCETAGERTEIGEDAWKLRDGIQRGVWALRTVSFREGLVWAFTNHIGLRSIDVAKQSLYRLVKRLYEAQHTKFNREVAINTYTDFIFDVIDIDSFENIGHSVDIPRDFADARAKVGVAALRGVWSGERSDGDGGKDSERGEELHEVIAHE